MIEQPYKINDTSKPAEIQKAFEHIHSQAIKITMADDEPTADTVPAGVVVVYDNGSGTKRLYVRTGKNNIGYVTLT